MGQLDGKVALITGGARGMGKSHVRHFAAEGAKVISGDVLDDLGEAVAAELGPDSCRYLHHDVASDSDWANSVSAAIDTFRPARHPGEQCRHLVAGADHRDAAGGLPPGA